MVQLFLHFVLLLIRRTWISLILWRLLVALAEVLGGIENLVLVQRLWVSEGMLLSLVVSWHFSVEILLLIILRFINRLELLVCLWPLVPVVHLVEVSSWVSHGLTLKSILIIGCIGTHQMLIRIRLRVLTLALVRGALFAPLIVILWLLLQVVALLSLSTCLGPMALVLALSWSNLRLILLSKGRWLGMSVRLAILLPRWWSWQERRAVGVDQALNRLTVDLINNLIQSLLLLYNLAAALFIWCFLLLLWIISPWGIILSVKGSQNLLPLSLLVVGLAVLCLLYSGLWLHLAPSTIFGIVWELGGSLLVLGISFQATLSLAFLLILEVLEPIRITLDVLFLVVVCAAFLLELLHIRLRLLLTRNLLVLNWLRLLGIYLGLCFRVRLWLVPLLSIPPSAVSRIIILGLQLLDELVHSLGWVQALGFLSAPSAGFAWWALFISFAQLRGGVGCDVISLWGLYLVKMQSLEQDSVLFEWHGLCYFKI